MRIVIIEDEQPAIDRLYRFIHNFNPSYQIVAQLDSVHESIEWLGNNLNPDLLFLDVHLSDGISFEILRNTGLSCPVIFTTSHPEYIANAFEAFAIDYLYKPIKREAFVKAMNRFLQRRPVSSLLQNGKTELGSNEQPEPQVTNDLKSERILVKKGQYLEVLELGEAAYYLYESRLTIYVSSENRRYPIDYSLDQLEKILPAGKFFRINRQSIVSYQSIGQILTYSKSRLKITLVSPLDKTFDISADRTIHFKQWLLNRGL